VSAKIRSWETLGFILLAGSLIGAVRVEGQASGQTSVRLEGRDGSRFLFSREAARSQFLQFTAPDYMTKAKMPGRRATSRYGK